MRFSPEFLDELRNRITLSDVVGRHVKLVRAGKEFSGLCPFHGEKSPSFTVNNQKEFYHCFGCGSHGNVFDFIMAIQGLNFPEAVTQLAGDVGMELPIVSRETLEKQEKASSLYDLMEAVASWYSEQLKTQAGAPAKAYIENTRKLTRDMIQKFRLGYAPDSRNALKNAMLAHKFSEQQLIDSGMIIKPDDSRESYDRFRNRLMFPITDKRGKIIAFGGRALDKNARAKYLNSPETTLFHKGYNLYNLPNARQAAYETGTIIVVEGYMDVIALAQYGINHAVAPLGTALTEEQIQLLWKMADEPVLCFDGDNAGKRASIRACERSLPLLKPGKSLRFVLLPAGEDPDTLVQKEGRSALDMLVDTAPPLVDILWDHLIGGVNIETPERRAGLENTVFSTLEPIEDEKIKKLYMSEFSARLRELFWHKQRKQQHIGKGRKRTDPTNSLESTLIGRHKDSAVIFENMERLLLCTILHHPELLVTHLEDFADIDFSHPEQRALQEAILDMAHEQAFLDFETLNTHLERTGLSAEMRKITNVRHDEWFVNRDAALADAETGFKHVLARYYRVGPALVALRQTEDDFKQDMTEANQKKFFAAKKVFEEIMGTEATIDDYGIASNRKNML